LIRAGRPSDAEAVLLRIESEVSKSSGQFLTPVIQGRSGTGTVYKTGEPRELLGAAYLGVTLMLWAAWFAEYGVLYTYQIFLPTILSAEGHSIVKSFRYSVVIYSSVIPGYVLGGYVVEWLDRKYTILLSFVSITAFGTLFGYSRSPVQIMTFAGLTVFFLSLGSTAIYTYTARTSSYRDSRDRYGDRVCLGTSGRRDHAFSFWTLPCHLGQIIIVSDDRPRSHRCRNCGPLLWPINS